MQENIFSLPIFIDKVDLSKIKLEDESLEHCFPSRVLSSFSKNNKIGSEFLRYLEELIFNNIKKIPSNYKTLDIVEIWRNVYKTYDHQDPHIHSLFQWSFIIYENVKKSNTVFLNPNRHLIETTMCGYDATFNGYYLDTNFMNDYKPNFKTGDIVIFPSFLEHFVLAGGKGSTISGNIICS